MSRRPPDGQAELLQRKLLRKRMKGTTLAGDDELEATLGFKARM